MSVKALAVGSLNGNFKLAFTKIAALNAKHGPFDMLLCAGDFFGPQGHLDADVEALLAGNITVPMPAYIIGGRNAPPERVLAVVEASGQVCENLVYLGEGGVMTTIQGLRIAYLSGVEEGEGVRCRHGSIDATVDASGLAGVDILLTTEWSKGISEGSVATAKFPEGSDVAGVPAVAYIAAGSQPRYHFAGAPGVFFEREPYRDQNGAKHVTRFIGLGEFQSKSKQRWFYAMNITPASQLELAQLVAVPKNTTRSPFQAAASEGNPRKRTAEQAGNGSFFFGEQGAKRQQGRSVPPSHYICNKCREPGHWIQDCPQLLAERPQGRRPENSLLPQRDAYQCWFCLSNPQLEKQLLVSVGSEAYLVLAKGGLVDWGGHMLVVPIAHHISTRQMETLQGEDAETARTTLAEMNTIKEKLLDLYAARDDVGVCFEVFGGGTAESLAESLQHVHLQVVPLSASLLPDIEPAFLREAKEEGLELTHDGRKPEAVTDTYFSVEIPTGDGGKERKTLVFRPSAELVEDHQARSAEAERVGRRPPRLMNLQFGRKVLSSLLGNPEAVDWKRVLLPPAQEEKLALKMRELVSLE
ncbi:hypothetical protein HKX48_004433 [Thoreauomyces humboldtii]|nr:hypothetical protein HKX48_004433 [Thoreauomyces humboldtii]